MGRPVTGKDNTKCTIVQLNDGKDIVIGTIGYNEKTEKFARLPRLQMQVLKLLYLEASSFTSFHDYIRATRYAIQVNSKTKVPYEIYYNTMSKYSKAFDLEKREMIKKMEADIVQQVKNSYIESRKQIYDGMTRASLALMGEFLRKIKEKMIIMQDKNGNDVQVIDMSKEEIKFYDDHFCKKIGDRLLDDGEVNQDTGGNEIDKRLQDLGMI